MSDRSHKIDKQALSTRYADLLDAQADADQLQLIDDLETLYTSASLPARLRQSIMDTLPSQQSVSPETQPVHAHTLRVTRPSRLRRKRWLQRLNAMAAVLVTALLVGSLLVVANLAHQGRSGGSPNIASEVATIHQLHMLDAKTGWAWAGTYNVLYTTDGGYHWKDVTPLQQPLGQGSYPFFLNASTAWIEAPQSYGGTPQLFHTTDGGQTWQQSTLPVQDTGDTYYIPTDIDFIDAQNGWLRVDVGKGTGSIVETDIYRTTDGGQDWTKITVSVTETNNTPGALPLPTLDTGVTFVNKSTGWVTGSSYTGSLRFYVTHDGGHTWYHQALPLPQGVSLSGGTITWPPQFFSADSSIILPVSFSAPTGLVVYITHDGGATWQGTSFLHTLLGPDFALTLWSPYEPVPSLVFADINHGWAWQSDPSLPSYSTSDGGIHWAKMEPKVNIDYIDLSDYDFVTSKLGWAIRVLTSKSPTPVPPTLFKTEDGGKTWIYIRSG